jgi:hypothetical protein
MFNKHRLTAAHLLLGGLLLVAPACASTGGYASYGADYGSRGYERRAFDNGYHDGFARGERDARAGRAFSYGRYRDDRDYRRSDGDRSFYRRFFRQGFENGYRDGFGRFVQDRRGVWR